MTNHETSRGIGPSSLCGTWFVRIQGCLIDEKFELMEAEMPSLFEKYHDANRNFSSWRHESVKSQVGMDSAELFSAQDLPSAAHKATVFIRSPVLNPARQLSMGGVGRVGGSPKVAYAGVRVLSV